jgi:hypothetical protein
MVDWVLSHVRVGRWCVACSMSSLPGVLPPALLPCDTCCCCCGRILDTRKTAPGLRLLDKWAVALGGGTPHRMGLYDMMMIKDNHIAAAGGIE